MRSHHPAAYFAGAQGLVGLETYVDVAKPSGALTTIFGFRDEAALRTCVADPVVADAWSRFDALVGTHGDGRERPSARVPCAAALRRLNAMPRPLHVVRRGDGPPVLLIHGTGATAESWGTAAERLAERCHVVTYDRRGTGRAAHLHTGHHDVHAEDAAEIIRTLGLGAVTVVGWSMGGIVALALAHRHPEVVRRLVLQEPPLYARNDLAFDVLRGIVPVIALSKLGMKVRAAERFNRWTYGAGGTGYDDWPESWKEATRRHARTICAEIDMGTGERVLPPAHIRAIAHPAVGLLGERSLAYYRRAMERLQQLLPHLRATTIPGGNHAMHVDATDAWVEAVASEAVAAR
jgi:pimeloyl-ACP methyl ester carboxylesterase